MAHQYRIIVRKTKEGEWKADAKKGNKILATAYGITRQKAITEVTKKMPEDKRFSVKIKRPPHGGYIVIVIDHQNGDRWEARDEYNYLNALNELEKVLPKAYFYQKHSNSKNDGINEWADHHGFRAIVLPTLIILVITSIIGILITGKFPPF